MRRRFLPLVVLLLAAASAAVLLGAVSALGEDGRVASKTYVQGTFVPPETDCTYDGRWVGPVAEPQGAYRQACFGIEPDETSFSLVVDDNGPFVVRGWYLFLDAEGRWMGYTSYHYCDAAEAVVPEGAAKVLVVVFEAHLGCEGASLKKAGAATAGTVTVTFR